MRITRTSVTVGLLVVEAGLAALGVSIHYGLTAEYGNISDSALEQFAEGFTSAGVSMPALVIVVVVGLVVVLVSTRPWIRVAALTLPVLVVLGMFAATPFALEKKREVQYDATPQCVFEETDMGPGPGTRAARESQEAFESIEHVGHFGGGGGSGVGGCDRRFVLMEDVDVVEHYRGALDHGGWQVVEDDDQHLRAERDDMAFEVAVCGQGGVVWAGPTSVGRGARCDGSERVGLSAPRR